MTDSWDTIADWYAERLRSGSAMHDFGRDILLNCLPEFLNGRRVLDFGCGEGIIPRAVARRGTSVLGIDPSPRTIEHARSAERRRPSGAVLSVDDGCTPMRAGS
jgi:2-polyprenyl-3-methyl-5-hydroxy-6-metoxy-1,4-benzoquinol methylase